MNIGEKIKELRVRRRMTQADLAGDTVSRNMVSLIENGRATPSVQTLEEIAAKYGLKLHNELTVVPGTWNRAAGGTFLPELIQGL